MWKTLSSKVILTHSRLIIAEDEVLLPSGHKTRYLKFVNAQNAALVICRREDGKILLQKEYSYPPNKILYQFPGGAIEPGEATDIAANRELMEEAGYRARSLAPLGSFFLNNRRSDSKMHVYLGTNLVKKDLPGDLEEDIESFWFTKEEITSLIAKGEIITQTTLASWALFSANQSYLVR